MAFIKKDTIYAGKDWFPYEVTFSVRNTRFSIKLPDKVAEAIGEKAVYAETLTAVENNLRGVIKKYEESLIPKKRRKVIVFKFQSTATIKNSSGKIIFKREDIGFRDDCTTALSVLWEVAFETFFRGQRSYTSEDGSHTSVNGTHIIQWSPKREKFFKKIDKNLHVIILKMDKFFDQSSRSIEKKIDAGIKL